MFAEVKAMIPTISGDDYDRDIVLNIKACAIDLESSTEIVLPGTVNLTATLREATTSEPEKWIVADNSTVKDELVFRVMAIYCTMNIGNPPNYDNLLKSYEGYKGQMRMSRRYNGGGADECEC
jgi:hypothetical protein